MITSFTPDMLFTTVLISDSVTSVFEVTSPVINTFPFPPAVSMAHLELGSPCKYKSNNVSYILSHILSGCFGETHSAVLIIYLVFVVVFESLILFLVFVVSQVLVLQFFLLFRLLSYQLLNGALMVG